MDKYGYMDTYEYEDIFQYKNKLAHEHMNNFFLNLMKLCPFVHKGMKS